MGTGSLDLQNLVFFVKWLYPLPYLRNVLEIIQYFYLTLLIFFLLFILRFRLKQSGVGPCFDMQGSTLVQLVSRLAGIRMYITLSSYLPPTAKVIISLVTSDSPCLDSSSSNAMLYSFPIYGSVVTKLPFFRFISPGKLKSETFIFTHN